MFKENYFNAKNKMRNNVIKSFFVYLSDKLCFSLFILTFVFFLYFLIYDTSFAASLGVFDSDFLLGTVCAVASVESVFLFIFSFYINLKKKAYFFGKEKMSFSYYSVIKYMSLELISLISRVISLFVFMSPFLLSVSSIILLVDAGISEKVFVLCLIGSFLLFITGIVSFLIYICKFTFIAKAYIFNQHLSVRQLFRTAQEESDGELLKLFRLKCKNLFKRIISLFIFPAIYYLPFCLFSEYDLMIINKKPYSHEANTEKSVVFYFDPVREN